MIILILLSFIILNSCSYFKDYDQSNDRDNNKHSIEIVNIISPSENFTTYNENLKIIIRSKTNFNSLIYLNNNLIKAFSNINSINDTITLNLYSNYITIIISNRFLNLTNNYIIFYIKNEFINLTSIYVSTNGVDNNPGTIEYPLLSIQKAISVALSNNIKNIFISSGVYRINNGLNSGYIGLLITNAKDLNIIGGFNTNYTYINGFSILDGTNDLRNIITIKNSKNITIRNLILQNARSDSTTYFKGAGLYIDSVSFLDISNVIINNCYSKKYGGGLYLINSQLSKYSITLINNFSKEDGGGGYISKSLSDRFNINALNNIAKNGGGIYLFDCDNITLYGNFINNISSNNGGGLYIENLKNSLIDSIFKNNISSNLGAAILLNSSENLIITNSRFEDNISFSDNSKAMIELYNKLDSIRNLTIIDNTFLNNYPYYTEVAISEYPEEDDVINHQIINNLFYTNHLMYLYCDKYQYIDNTRIDDLNNNLYSGAFLTKNNRVLPLSYSLENIIYPSSTFFDNWTNIIITNTNVYMFYVNSNDLFKIIWKDVKDKEYIDSFDGDIEVLLTGENNYPIYLKEDNGYRNGEGYYIRILQSEYLRLQLNRLKDGLISLFISRIEGTNDITPPIFKDQTPKITETKGSSIKLSAKINERGYLYYIILQGNNNPLPSAAQISQGRDFYNNPVLIKGSLYLPQNSLKTTNIIGLNFNTTYQLFATVKDLNNNLQNNIFQTNFTTLSSISSVAKELEKDKWLITNLNSNNPNTNWYYCDIIANKEYIVGLQDRFNQATTNGTNINNLSADVYMQIFHNDESTPLYSGEIDSAYNNTYKTIISSSNQRIYLMVYTAHYTTYFMTNFAILISNK